uniref:Uncharacterized protein n=1 Tax=Anopheles braziliensis TaxID=58242 RepID=A0A2M3ZM15_9DIPT
MYPPFIMLFRAGTGVTTGDGVMVVWGESTVLQIEFNGYLAPPGERGSWCATYSACYAGQLIRTLKIILFRSLNPGMMKDGGTGLHRYTGRSRVLVVSVVGKEL